MYKKYIFVTLLLFLPLYVYAETKLYNYNVNIEVENEQYFVKESFVPYILEDAPYYEKEIPVSAKIIETNLDDYQIEKPAESREYYENSVLSFKINDKFKEYYIKYEMKLDEGSYFNFYGLRDVFIYKLSAFLTVPSGEELNYFDINTGSSAKEFKKEGNTASWYYENVGDVTTFTIVKKSNTVNKSSKRELSSDELDSLIKFTNIVPAILLFFIIFNSLFFRDELYSPVSYIMIGFTAAIFLLLNFSYSFIKGYCEACKVCLSFCGAFFPILFWILFYSDIKLDDNNYSKLFLKIFAVSMYGLFLHIGLIESNKIAFNSLPIYNFIIAIVILFFSLEISSRYYWSFKKVNKESSKYKPINSYHFKYEKKNK